MSGEVPGIRRQETIDMKKELRKKKKVAP